MTLTRWCFRHIGANFDDIPTGKTQPCENCPTNRINGGKLTQLAAGKFEQDEQENVVWNQQNQETKLDACRKSLDVRPHHMDKKDKQINYNVGRWFIRRSTRIPRQKQKSLTVAAINLALATEEETGIELFYPTNKGRGIRTLQPFRQGEYIVSYRGELITKKKAMKRAAAYKNDPNLGSFMYFFTFQSRKYCIDATVESRYYGRLVNHSFRNPNVVTKLHLDQTNKPHIIMVAKVDLDAGVELQYNYGENDLQTIRNNPWLKNT